MPLEKRPLGFPGGIIDAVDSTKNSQPKVQQERDSPEQRAEDSANNKPAAAGGVGLTKLIENADSTYQQQQLRDGHRNKRPGIFGIKIRIDEAEEKPYEN